MEMLNQIERGQLCSVAIQAYFRGEGALSNFPGLLRKIIDNKAWESRVEKGKVIELKSLHALITKQPIEGWGEDPQKIEALIKDDIDLLTMYRDEMVAPKGGQEGNLNAIGGGDTNTDNISIRTKDGHGTSASYTAKRLREQHPEVYEDLKAGKHKSINSAAVAAGIRTRTQTIPYDPTEAAKALKRKYSKTELDTFINALQGA